MECSSIVDVDLDLDDCLKMATECDIGEKIPCILDGTFFKIIKNKDGKIIAECTNCLNNKISGTLATTSNFLRHIKVDITYTIIIFIIIHSALLLRWHVAVTCQFVLSNAA